MTQNWDITKEEQEKRTRKEQPLFQTWGSSFMMETQDFLRSLIRVYLHWIPFCTPNVHWHASATKLGVWFIKLRWWPKQLRVHHTATEENRMPLLQQTDCLESSDTDITKDVQWRESSVLLEFWSESQVAMQCWAWGLRISKWRDCAVKGTSVVSLKLQGNVAG